MAQVKEVNKTLMIPVQLMQFSINNNLIYPLRLLCYFKLFESGKFKHSKDAFKQLGEVLGYKDTRTIKKYFNQCRRLNWIGFDPCSKIYFVRSFNTIMTGHNLETPLRIKFEIKDLSTFKEFVFASNTCDEIKRQERYWRLPPSRRYYTALKSTEGATQYIYKPSSDAPDHFGIGLARLARNFKCSITTVHNLKKMAVEAGYIAVNHKFDLISEYEYSQPFLLERAKEANPRIAYKLRIRRVVDRIQIVTQLHDEIVPLLTFKKVKDKSSSKNLVVRKENIINGLTPPRFLVLSKKCLITDRVDT
jgi:hypothetical protein